MNDITCYMPYNNIKKNYNTKLVGKASKPNTIQGIHITYPTIKGNNTVQQTDIN